MRPALAALLIQCGAAAAAFALVRASAASPALWWPLQAGLAAGASVATRQPRWWWLIHLAFMPAAALALRLGWPPWLYLCAFVLAWLLFGRIDRSRVPLYLSNRLALDALLQRVPPGGRVLDLGAGTGTVLAYLARRPGIVVEGVEHAWLPWLLARLRLLRRDARVWRGDLMRWPLAGYDVVYAFLSPAAMPSLWRKAKAEMRPGSLFVSNSFPVPDVDADEIIELDDWKGARLYLWRMR